MKIEKNIPAPEKSDDRKRRYPFVELEPGDSVYIEGAKPTGKEATTFRVTCHRKGWDGRSASEKNGVRFWRVS